MKRSPPTAPYASLSPFARSIPERKEVDQHLLLRGSPVEGDRGHHSAGLDASWGRTVRQGHGAWFSTRMPLLSAKGSQRALRCQSSSGPLSVGNGQIRAVLSVLAVTTRVLSGLNAAAVTPP